MKLYFLRHTDALEGAEDAARRLSPKGKAQAHKIGQFLKRAEINFDAAYCSPLIRARETAEVVLEVSNGQNEAKLEETKALLNEVSLEEFDDWLDGLPGVRHVLLVGHAPSIGERVCHLLGVSDSSRLKFSKGGLACVQTEERRTGELKFLVSPKVLGV
jgi:phosphohistidine phosphatase